MSYEPITDKAITDAPIDTLCMGCEDNRCDLKPMKFQRRPMGERDVLIKMKYCGVCHSDLSFAAGQALPVTYPLVPGHELAGVAVACGSKCEKIKVGMHVGIGCIVGACGNCKSCKKGEEQKCMNMTSTYGAKDKTGRAATYPAGEQTLGGYTTMMVCDERYVIIVPDEYPLEYVGPLMCAGITMYDPLKRQGVAKGSRVGIIGLGGLGQMGIKIAKALGCIVTGISRRANKKELATESGADRFLVSKSKEEMDNAVHSLDLILNTIPVSHDYLFYNSLLDKGGKQVLLGLHKGVVTGMLMNKLTGGKSKVISSVIGGINATQKVVDLCHEHKIHPNIKIIPVNELNNVFELLDSSNEAGLRYVLDIEGSLTDEVEKKYESTPPKLQPSHSDLNCCSVCCDCCFVFCCCKWC